MSMNEVKELFRKGLICLVAMVALSSCSDDDDDVAGRLPDAVQRAFAQKYPLVNPSWERDGGLYKAEFQDDYEVEAWFRSNGEWVRTETDLKGTDPPSLVQDYVDKHYGGYRIDDLDLIEMPGPTSYYVIELEKNGQPDVRLKLGTNGQLIP